MLTTLLKSLLLAALVPALAACGGWELRGAGSLPFKSAYLEASAAPTVAQAIRTELATRGIGVVANRENADVVITLDGEAYDRRVLSVDPDTGKVREIELGLEVHYAVRSSEGKLIVPREPLTWQQDYIFDEGSLLGTVEQDFTIRRNLAESAATALVLRLRAITLPGKSPS